MLDVFGPVAKAAQKSVHDRVRTEMLVQRLQVEEMGTWTLCVQGNSG